MAPCLRQRDVTARATAAATATAHAARRAPGRALRSGQIEGRRRTREDGGR